MSFSKVTKENLKELTERIQTLYLSDQIPWVVGYSGGKDSTTVLQLVWYALSQLSPEKKNHKDVYVISTDTLVEQPIVAAWVNKSLRLMEKQAEDQKLRIYPKRLTPETDNSYWVNLIGRGYPAPRTNFRWCTSRLKIEPSNRFITDVVKQNGEAIMVLGTRKAESATRANNMNRYEQLRTRDWLSPNASLMNSWVFTPIEDWTSDDVWMYLMQVKNPWGCSNKDLMAMYREATADNECPLVVDTTTPSCGNSRFGCWVCTLVSEDKSMQAMIQNDEEKVWMNPLLDFRNKEIGSDSKGKIDDFKYRDYRRMNGSVKLFNDSDRDSTIHGPYIKDRREHLLRKLLEVQKEIQETGPKDVVEDLKLISIEELEAIRKIWVINKSEFDDAVPRIYEEVLGEPYPNQMKLTRGNFGQDEWAILKEISGDDYVRLDLLASILSVDEKSHRFGTKKSYIQELERHIRRCLFNSEEDAINYKKRQQELKKGEFQLEELDELDQLEEVYREQ